MTPQMIRKQIYIQKRQNTMLKYLSKVGGLSEAEIIRHAIEHELVGTPGQPIAPDRSTLQDLDVFLEARQKTAESGKPYHWVRVEIYTERENRLLHYQTQE